MDPVLPWLQLAPFRLSEPRLNELKGHRFLVNCHHHRQYAAINGDRMQYLLLKENGYLLAYLK